MNELLLGQSPQADPDVGDNLPVSSATDTAIEYAEQDSGLTDVGCQTAFKGHSKGTLKCFYCK